MPWKLAIRAGELLVTATLLLALTAAWRADRNDRAQLAAELASAKQSMAQVDDRQHTRDSQLLQTLATLAADKRTVTTPTQIIRELPQQLDLPVPITLQPATPNSPETKPNALEPKTGPTPPPESTAANPSKGDARSQAVIPAADLKPLYDFALDCKACQAKLSAAQGDLTDEKTKNATLAKERDEALRAAKGGSLLRRIARATKWFVLGAAAGAIAARVTH
ncbi:MAG: hypothetical protein ABSH13_22195 [Candidatus Acidiferrum sp.]|jgi:hypothetical protein